MLKKTQFIVFRPQTKTLNCNAFLKLMENRIYPRQSVKYLGVHLDEHLIGKYTSLQ